ncbi:MAG: TMEM43 family protein [Alphaproteobacteria bacterium]|nr:TMEM43 family protein [Alphaproteobacteria bacterium]MBL7098226.1 TMEM43 family protein [Alphaproteobacteria bacterium]
MPNTFTTTTTTGFGSRIMNSFVGLLLGPVLVIGAIWLLGWNEGRAVQAIRGLAEAQSVLVESPAGSVNPGNEGKLVHVTGEATATAAIQDSDMGLSFDNQVAVARTAEMYEWKEKKEEKTQDNTGGSQTTTTTYTYSMVWSDTPIDSSSFAHPEGHENPAMPFTSHKFAATDAKLGEFNLDDATVGMVDASTALKPDAPDGWTASGGNLYKGANPASPAVGDMRVHYTGLASGSTISVLAKQAAGGFADYTTTNGYTIHMARAGNVPADQLIADQKKMESMITWILRGVGAFLIFIGFTMFFGPIATLAAVLPFLGALVRGASAFFALVLTIPVTLIVIAFSWLAFRPLIAVPLLIAAAVFGYVLWRWHHARSAPHVAAQQAAAAAGATPQH